MPNRRARKTPRVQKQIARAFRQEHGYVCNRTPHDPPNCKETVEFPVRIRYQHSVPADETPAALTIKTNAPPLGAIAYKVIKVSAWVSNCQNLELTLTEVEAGTSSIKTSDRAGRNHFASCSIKAPQDDWFQVASGAVNYYNIIVLPSLKVSLSLETYYIVDVVYNLRLNVPIQSLALKHIPPAICLNDLLEPKDSSLENSTVI